MDPVDLEFNGKRVKVEKDMQVFVPFKCLHYDPEYYPEPETFNPERFDPENGGSKAFADKGVFMPFGYGPRICLGMRIGTLQSLAAIAGIVKNFEILVNAKTDKNPVLEPTEFIHFAKGGWWLDFKPL